VRTNQLPRQGAPGAGSPAAPETTPPSLEHVANRLAHWGFLAEPDLPDVPGPASLLVALRPAPSLTHYDPEAVDYWVAVDGRGERRTLTRDSPMPRSEPFSWGLIRLVDRLAISNEYLTFGGRLDAARIGDTVIAAFTSDAPLLRRGGHSQGLDAGADAIGAFFGRLMVAVDYTDGFEQILADADPVTRYAAFVREALERLASHRADGRLELEALLRHERLRLETEAPAAWTGSAALLGAADRSSGSRAP
jgi:hypothetical protein